LYTGQNSFAFYRGHATSSGNQARGKKQKTNQQPDDPCNCGLAGNTLNNDMYADEILRDVFDTLQTKIQGENEWTLSISKSDNKYKPSDLKEHNLNDGKIPPYPDGEEVANAHTHPRGNSGVPSGGDLYSFLESVRKTNTIKTMFVIGSKQRLKRKDTIEVYAFNVYDTSAVENFLEKYPKKENKNFKQELDGEVGIIYQKAKERFNTKNPTERNVKVRYANRRNKYDYFPEAVALAYTLWYFKTGVTLSRKVDNEPFMVISVIDIMKRKKNILDVSVCK